MNELVISSTAQQQRIAIIQQGDVLKDLSPADASVLKASAQREFQTMNEREIAVYLSKVLPNVMRDCGYRQKEDDLQYLCGRLPGVLIRLYGYLSVKDFLLAFEMTFTGDLDAFLPKNSSGTAERGHYQSFGVEYVSRILTAYAGYRRKVMVQAEKYLQKESLYTKEDEQANRLKTRARLSEAFSEYKSSRKKLQLSPISEMLFFDILVSMGLCEPIPDDNREQDAIISATIPAGRYVTPQWLLERREKRHAGIYAAFDELIKKNKTI